MMPLLTVDDGSREHAYLTNAENIGITWMDAVDACCVLLVKAKELISKPWSHGLCHSCPSCKLSGFSLRTFTLWTRPFLVSACILFHFIISTHSCNFNQIDMHVNAGISSTHEIGKKIQNNPRKIQITEKTKLSHCRVKKNQVGTMRWRH